MQSELAKYLRAWLDENNETIDSLAEKAKQPRGSVANIFTRPKTVPKYGLLARLADATGIPLTILLEKTGVDLPPPKNETEEQARLLTAVDAVPRLRPLLPKIALLDAHKQRDILRYIEYVLAHAESVD